MKKNILLTGLLLITFCFAFGQVKTGEFTIGASGNQGCSVIQSKDGGYAMAGITSSYGAGGNDIYIAKLDSNANLLWTRTVGGAGDDEAYSIIQSKDGGYAVAGYTSSFGIGSYKYDVYVIKLNSSGNIEWTRTIGGTGYDEGYSIVQSNDGGYVVAGITSSFGAGQSNVYVIKLDSIGNLKWTRTVGGTSYDGGRSIALTKDGGYAVTGYTSSFGVGGSSNNPNVYVVRLDSAGNLKWTKTIGDRFEEGYSIIQSKDDGFAIAGYTESYTRDSNNGVYVVKLDSVGNLKWTAVFSDTNQTDTNYGDEGYSIVQTNDLGYVVSDYSYSWSTDNTSGKSELRVIKVDSSGGFNWDKKYSNGGSSFSAWINYPSSIILTRDGGYASTWVNDYYSYGLFLLKTDSAGNDCSASEIKPNINSGGIVSSGGIAGSGGSITTMDSGKVSSGGSCVYFCEVLTSTSDISPPLGNNISVYPNPSHGVFTIQSSVNSGQSSVEIYNILGMEVYNAPLNPPVRGTSSTTISLPYGEGQGGAGIYLYRIISEKGELVGSGKIVIQ